MKGQYKGFENERVQDTSHSTVLFEKDMANTGSWVTDADKKYSYLVIDEGTMELKFFTR